MRKLLIIITLFASSFFLFNGNVKAAEYNVNLDFSFINDDFLFFKSSMEDFLEKVKITKKLSLHTHYSHSE